MARFLSDEWIAELDGAVSSDDEVRRAASGLHLTIQQVVVVGTGDREGDPVRYAIRVDEGRVRLQAGQVDDADATITEDYDTAAALAQGTITPQDAILAGKVQVRGDMGALLKAQEVLERMRGCFDGVRARTDY